MLLFVTALVVNITANLEVNNAAKRAPPSLPMRIIRLPHCSCVQTPWEPICGRNGRTYKNRMDLGCSGHEVGYMGTCCKTKAECVGKYLSSPMTRLCTLNETNDDLLPELGCYVNNSVRKPNTGINFSYDWSLCWSRRHNVPRCLCDLRPEPICGTDGETYFNECEAICWGVTVAYQGVCKPCGCPIGYKPVCTMDGITYDNICLAKCAGKKLKSGGACPVSSSPKMRSFWAVMILNFLLLLRTVWCVV